MTPPPFGKIPNRSRFFLQMASLREAIRKKKRISFGHCPKVASTPSPVFLERFKELFLNLILYKLKFLKVLGFWSSSLIFLGKMSKPKQKKVPHHLWNQATPPLFLKNFQTQAEKFLKKFGLRHSPPSF